MQRSDFPGSADNAPAQARARRRDAPTPPASAPRTAATQRTRVTTAASRLTLVFVIAVVGVIACAGPGAHNHDHIHASCFELVTGHGSSLSLSTINTSTVENPTPSPAPPTPSRNWSDASRWPNGTLPAEGDDVVIPLGEVVQLDVSTPHLGTLLIAGDLVFARQDLNLTANNIEIRGGLYVGSATQPFTNRAVITVGSEELGTESDCFGHNYIGLVHGTLEIYGDAEGRAWTRLAAHAAEGDTSILVDDASGWQPGDQIALASTDFYSNTSGENTDRRIEVRTLTNVNGNTLNFDEPLQYARYGQNQTFPVGGYPTTVLESRAEVMRLTRNVTISGLAATADDTSDVSRDGAHIKALGESRVRLDSVELTAMGQYGVLMRYPVHFHLQGAAALGSFVRNSSLHHLYNRCITIHGSSGVLLEDNAAYNTFGHCYFFEDGAETRNVLKGNFGMMAREPLEAFRLIPTDGGHMGPSIFWVTNPDNVLVNNVAAHSAGSGFWYSLPEHPTGPSYNIFDGENVWPRQTPLGRFEGNLAHSNQNDGLHVDRGPRGDTLAAETASYRPRSEPGNRNSAPVTAVFENFVAYKHRSEAAWFRGDHTQLVGALLVDNAIGATFASNLSGMANSVVIARSANEGTAEHWENTEAGRPIPRPWQPMFAPRGFQFYDGAVFVSGSYFDGFVPFGDRKAGAISFLDYTSFSLSPQSYAEGITFGPNTVRVMFADLPVALRQDRARDEDSGNDGYASGVFVDRDGSVSAKAGAAVTVNNPLLQEPSCEYRSDWNANVCQHGYVSLTLRNTSGDAIEMAPVVLSKGSVGSSASHTMFGTPNGGPNTHFRALVPVGNDYHYQLAGNTPRAVSVEMAAVTEGDSMLVSLPYSAGLPFIYRDWWIDARNTLERYTTLAALRGASNTGYFYDEGGGRLYLRLLVQGDRDYAHLTVCTTSLCK